MPGRPIVYKSRNAPPPVRPNRRFCGLGEAQPRTFSVLAPNSLRTCADCERTGPPKLDKRTALAYFGISVTSIIDHLETVGTAASKHADRWGGPPGLVHASWNIAQTSQSTSESPSMSITSQT